ncbi:MAG: DUF2490 domain-containing protein [Flavobacteriales bacterium]|nr:DUF2490 domain-containing protein [Flavobacteriales bacterium]
MLCACFSARAQEKPLRLPSTDAELWLSSGFEMRFFKEKKKSKKVRTPEQQEKDAAKQKKLERSFKYNFRLTGEVGYRGNENLTSSKLFYTVAGVRYRFHKYARLTLEHRYNFRDKYSNNTHRIDVQGDTEYKFGKYGIGYRLIWQHEFVVPIRYRDIVRNRVQLSWRTPKFDFDPYVAAESFTALHFTGNRIIGMRYGGGVEWEITKDHAIDLSLRYDREQNLSNLQYRWIFGVAYEYKFKP